MADLPGLVIAIFRSWQPMPGEVALDLQELLVAPDAKLRSRAAIAVMSKAKGWKGPGAKQLKAELEKIILAGL